jgi:two-component system cell cycle sensor histidine kinase/response regulator CckA
MASGADTPNDSQACACHGIPAPHRVLFDFPTGPLNSIPLYVSAAGVLTVIAVGFAVTFAVLDSRYARPYLRTWRDMWIALALYAAASGTAVLMVSVPSMSAVRVALSASAILAAWWHLRSLDVGMRLLCEPDAKPVRWIEWKLGIMLAVAVGLLFLPTAETRDVAFQRYLVRTSLLAAAWGFGYGWAAWTILRHPGSTSALGRRTLAGALIAYAVMRVLEPLTHFIGPSPILAQFLTFGGLPLLVAMAAGMLVSLLEVERARAVAEMSARADAEHTATASEAALATALASSSDPVVIVDLNGRVIAQNERFRQILRDVRGIEVEIGTPVESLVRQHVLAFWRDAFGRALQGESQMRTEQFVVTPDGVPRPFGVRVTPVRRGGEVIGVLFVAHDATEEEKLRAAISGREEWFRSMIEHSSDIIFQLSRDGTIEYVSPSLERVLGRKPAELVGQSGFDHVHPDDAAPLRDAMLRSFARDESLPPVVPFRAQAASLEWVTLEAVSRPYIEPDGTPHLIMAARDVRERRRLETELLAARRLESIGRLAGGVAHDFNNLLTAVIGNLTLIRERPAAKEFGENLDEIEQSVRRGADLTRRLLAFARRQMIEPRVVTLAPQVTEMERLLRRLIGERIKLEVNLPVDLWAVRVDPLALEQMIVNLAVNARDAMPDGGTLRISATNLTIATAGHTALGIAAGDWVRLNVEDTGVGIEESIIPHIFEPFFTTKGDSGTGLGLATVHGAVSQAGGHARVESVQGRGTTFSIYLPRIVTATPTQTGMPTAPTLPRAKPGETVLLIEDEQSVREVTAKLLAKLGYEVVTAVDGRDGVNRAAAYDGVLHLVLTDLMMPELGGVEAAQEIRKLRPEIPVLFISGYSEQSVSWRDDMKATGRLLSKPFSVDELARAIRQAIDV